MIIREFKQKRQNSNKTDIKVEYECDICRKLNQTFKNNLKNKTTHKCKDCSNKKNGLLKRGKANKSKGKPRKHLSREKAANWNGGRYINKAGYVMILIKSGSTNRKSGWENYRPEHIIVMEKFLGRTLHKKECVHHIDGDKQNNRIDNLVIIDSNEHHRKTHHSLQKIGYEIIKKGKIKFNRNNNLYELFPLDVRGV